MRAPHEWRTPKDGGSWAAAARQAEACSAQCVDRTGAWHRTTISYLGQERILCLHPQVKPVETWDDRRQPWVVTVRLSTI